MKWKDISLRQFQSIMLINDDKAFDEDDKKALVMSVVYDKTEGQLSKLPRKKLLKMLAEMNRVLMSEIKPKVKERIGIYKLDYDINAIRFGQYVELSEFINRGPIQNAHYILASIARLPFKKNDSANHRKVSNYFLNRSIVDISASLGYVMDKLNGFNMKYRGLFELDEETEVSNESHPFNRQFGWIYSATIVADHERITLDEAFNLPVQQALNALSFVKAKRSYEQEQLKKNATIN